MSHDIGNYIREIEFVKHHICLKTCFGDGCDLAWWVCGCDLVVERGGISGRVGI